MGLESLKHIHVYESPNHYVLTGQKKASENITVAEIQKPVINFQIQSCSIMEPEDL